MRESVVVLDAYRPTGLAPLPFGPENFAGNLALAPEVPDFVPQTQEKYAHSLGTYRKVGEIAAGSCLLEADMKEDLPTRLCKTPEGRAIVAMLRSDFDRALGEMLNTDKEFSHKLDIEPEDEFSIQDGEPVMEDGTPVSEMIGRGFEKSKEAAEEDWRMNTQAARDEEDLINFQAAKAMRPGRLRFVVSMPPKKAMDRDGEKFWADKLGYRRGLAFGQWFFKPDEETLHAGSVSVDDSNKMTWAEMYAERDVPVDPETPDEKWISHAIEIECKTVEEARQYAKNMRREYYQKRGIKNTRNSVTEFVEVLEKSVVDQIFNDLVLPLTVSVFTSKKHEATGELAEALLNNSHGMKAEMRRELVRIRNTDDFDDHAGRVMEFMIRYGAAETLRKKLPNLFQKTTRKFPNISSNYAPLSSRHMVMALAGNVANGVYEGRTYGGCAAGFDMSSDSRRNSDGFDQETERNAQQAFGGNAKKDAYTGGSIERKNWKKTKGSCRTPTCPNNKKKVDLGPCGVCMHRCQELFYDKGKDPNKI